MHINLKKDYKDIKSLAFPLHNSWFFIPVQAGCVFILKTLEF